MSQQILKGTFTVSMLTMISRVLGFFRDLLTAYLFGATYLADAFFVAFKIPNLLRSFVAEGALTNAFVPVFIDELAQNKERAVATIRSVISFLLIITSILAVTGMIFSKEIILAIAPGFVGDTEKEQLCVLLTRIMLPYIVCVSVVAMLNGALNAVGIFGRSAWAQIYMNICLIIAAIIACFFTSETAIFILASSVLVGGIVQVIVQIPIVHKSGFSLLPSARIFTKATKQIFILMIPAILGVAAYQLQILINTQMASVLMSGSVSWLFYADRIVQLPIGVFTVALSSVLLPSLAKAATNNNAKSFSDDLVNSLRYVSFVILPIAGALYLFAEPLCWLLFERGKFTHESTLATARAVQNYALGIWAVSTISVLIRVFFAKKDTLTPTLLGVLTLIFTVLFSLMFMGNPVSGAGNWMFDLVTNCREFLVPDFNASLFNLQHAGLALGSSVASFCSLIVVLFVISRKNEIHWLPFILATLKTIIVVLIVGLVVMFLNNTVLDVYSSLSKKYSIMLIIFFPIYLFLLGVLFYLFRTKEFFETLGVLKKVVKR